MRRAVHPLRDAAIALASLDRVFDADTHRITAELKGHQRHVAIVRASGLQTLTLAQVVFSA